MTINKKEKRVQWPTNDPIVEAAPVLNGQRAALRRLTDEEKHELGLIFELDVPPNQCVDETDDEDEYIPVAERPSLMSSSTFASMYSNGSTSLPPLAAMPAPLPPPMMTETPSFGCLVGDSVELERFETHSHDSECTAPNHPQIAGPAGLRKHAVEESRGGTRMGPRSSNRRRIFDSKHQPMQQHMQHPRGCSHLSAPLQGMGSTITAERQCEKILPASFMHTHEETLQVL